MNEETVNCNGFRVYYSKKGTGKPIVYIHGWALASSDFDCIPNSLAKDYAIYLPDLPGFGKSKIQKEKITFDDYSLILKEFIEKLKIENPVLIGFSMGCLVSIHFASHYQNLISGIILGGSPFSFDSYPKKLKSSAKKIIWIDDKIPILTKILEKIIKQESLLRILWKQAEPKADFESEIIKKTLTAIKNTSFKLTKNLLSDFIKLDMNEISQKIQIPTLLLAGENDYIVPKEQVEAYLKTIQNSKYYLIEKADHSTILDDKSEKIILDFLGKECF